MTERPIIPAPASSVACHEAAHAVVAEHLGFAIESVTIVPTKEFNGAARFLMPKPVAELGSEVDWLIRQATIFAAGRAGEALFGFLTADVQDDPRSDDAAFAAILAPVAVDEEEAHALAAWVRARAAAIVAKLAPEIATVAKSLDVNKTLQRAQLRRLMPSLADGRISPIGLRVFSIPSSAVAAQPR